jgi:hypothetical protein
LLVWPLYEGVCGLRSLHLRGVEGGAHGYRDGGESDHAVHYGGDRRVRHSCVDEGSGHGRCGTRCSRVSGNTSRRAPQSPSAPSPTASTGPACRGWWLLGDVACGCRKFRPCRSCGVLVFVEYAAESVSSADVELVESAWFDEGVGRGPEGRAFQGAVGSVFVVEGLELAECVEQVCLVPDQGAVKEFVSAGLYPALSR